MTRQCTYACTGTSALVARQVSKLCADLCVLEHGVGALALALETRPALAVVQDFKHSGLLVGGPRHVCTVARLGCGRGLLLLFAD